MQGTVRVLKLYTYAPTENLSRTLLETTFPTWKQAIVRAWRAHSAKVLVSRPRRAFLWIWPKHCLSGCFVTVAMRLKRGRAQKHICHIEVDTTTCRAVFHQSQGLQLCCTHVAHNILLFLRICFGKTVSFQKIRDLLEQMMFWIFKMFLQLVMF